MSVPEEYDGFASGGEADYLGMVVATEELSWGSLGVGGSLITRPEILTRAILAGGTEEQKQRWLPRIAAGELMVGVTVTEPDYGSDVAGITTMATRRTDGGYRVNGVKTWATFAGRADLLMLLARTDPDRTQTHRGLSMFVVEKEPVPGPLVPARAGGRRPSSRAAPSTRSATAACTPMKSSFSDWFVPAENLSRSRGRARAQLLPPDGGLRERAPANCHTRGGIDARATFEAGTAYSLERKVFGKPVFEYQLSQAKLTRMATLRPRAASSPTTSPAR